MDSPPSDTSKACGVGDYTYLIADYLRRLSVETRVFDRIEWNKEGILGLRKELDDFEADILHIQYPPIGYFRSLTASLFSAFSPAANVFVTIHEYTQAHPLRKLCIGFMARHADGIIFTSEFELQEFLRKTPNLKSRPKVVPIASNINFPATLRSTGRDPYTVIYFGQLRPEKGIEDFIELVRLSAEEGRHYKFNVVGTPHPDHLSYYNRLRESQSKLPLHWEVGRSAKDVEEIFGESTYAYLPFPDGASERRGSLLAVLSNGLATITTLGSQTPEGLKGAVTFADSPSDALQKLDMLFLRPGERDETTLRGVEFARRFTWEEIAKSHYAFYDKILRERGYYDTLQRR